MAAILDSAHEQWAPQREAQQARMQELNELRERRRQKKEEETANTARRQLLRQTATLAKHALVVLQAVEMKEQRLRQREVACQQKQSWRQEQLEIQERRRLAAARWQW